MNQSTSIAEKNISVSSRVIKRHKALYLHFLISTAIKSSTSGYNFEPYAYEMIEFTRMLEPEPDQYLLLGSSNNSNQSSSTYPSHDAVSGAGDAGQNRSTASRSATLHALSKVSLQLMLHNASITKMEIPPEVFDIIRFQDRTARYYFPLLWLDRMALKRADYRPVPTHSLSAAATGQSDGAHVDDGAPQVAFELRVQRVSVGMMRLWILFQRSFDSLRGLGFTEKDVDEVKGIFTDTSPLLLLVTFVVSAFHLLFDILRFRLVVVADIRCIQI